MKSTSTLAAIAVQGLMLTALGGCASTPMHTAANGADALIPTDTVTALNQGGRTRDEIAVLLGKPSYTGAEGRFIAYERNAPFRTLSPGGPVGASGNNPFRGAVRQDVIYYQVVGVWLDHAGNVVQAKEFVAPCASCDGGDSLLSQAELEQWMRGNQPRYR